MHSFTIHESRNLKQARPKGQYVDLLRYTLATPSWDFMNDILSLSMSFVKLFKYFSIVRHIRTSCVSSHTLLCAMISIQDSDKCGQ